MTDKLNILSIIVWFITVILISQACNNSNRDNCVSQKPQTKGNSIYDLKLATINDSINISKLNAKVFVTTECKECYNTYFIQYNYKLYKDKNDFSVIRINNLDLLVTEQAMSDHFDLSLAGLNSFLRDYETSEKKILTFEDLSPIIEIYFQNLKPLELKN